MTRYLDLDGDSGVAAYSIGPTSITVRFVAGRDYRYDHASAGREHIETMKALARGGRGLCRYINQHVAEDYASRN